jgi:hypothetical protein
MIKRVIWLGMGAVIGASGSVWANRRVRRMVDRYAPVEVRHRIEDRVRTASGHVRSAVHDGRDAMREREAELRGRADMPRRNSSGRHRAGR